MRKCASVVLLVLCLAAPARAQDIVVFAAASLSDALQEIGRGWQAQGGHRLRFSFAASSTLARQLDQGAAAGVFASADLAWMDWAQSRGLIVDASRRNLLGNRLVLVVPRAQARNVTIDPRLDIAALLGPRGRLAMADPDTVPAGIYGKQALTSFGLWGTMMPRVARTENVRGALLLVERGEAPAAIVYATDAAATAGVAVAGVFPEGSHAPIVYPFAVTRAGDTPAARAVLTYLSRPEASAIFRKHGFLTDPGM